MIPIALLTLIKTSFFNPGELWRAMDLSKRKSIVLYLMICFFTTIPYFSSGLFQYDVLASNMASTEAHLPTFTIENDQIVFEPTLEKAIVSKTDFVTLIIDPNQKYDDNLKTRAIEAAPIGIVFGKDAITVYTSNRPIAFNYKDLNGTTDQFIRSFLLQFSQIGWLFIPLLILFSFLAGLIEASFYLLYLTIFANLWTSFMRIRLPFAVNWKMIMTAAVVPMALLAIMNSFGIQPGAQTLILLIIVIYMYNKGIKSYLKNIT